MIAYLEGQLLFSQDASIVVNVNGVGYEMLCSQNSLDDFVQAEAIRAHIYTHVKEDAIQLFGFSTTNEKMLFLSLIKVNGIGPKMATQILSGATLENICKWVEEGDVKALTSLPKVGKKTAEQIVLTLKGKLVFVEDQTQSKSTTKSEVQSALVNLGFKLSDVEKVTDKLAEDLSVEEGVRASLHALTNV